MTELETIEFLIAWCGFTIEEVEQIYPHQDKETIKRLAESINNIRLFKEFDKLFALKFICDSYMSNKFIVKSILYDSGKDIKTALLRLAERKTIREMGMDIPLGFYSNNPI